MKTTLLFILTFLLLTVIAAQAQDATPEATASADESLHFIPYRGQELFLNGINLAWISFAHDLQNFNEPLFVAALDEVKAAHGNTLRWWLHTNGSASPVYGDDGKVTGLGEHDVEKLQRAADLAYERGVLLLPTLWSHDMMNDQQGVPTEANRKLIEDPEYTQAYIDNALIPLVTALKGNPGIVAWEIFNEPEGTTRDFGGWTDELTDMRSIQQFINSLAGAIHRTDPDALVTNGSWSMRALTDVGSMKNYYTDAELIAAGGDPDGTLDFYQVHYYPQNFGNDLNPFSHPYAYWQLDKPLIVGEFPAKPTPNRAAGFTQRNSMETYEYLYENGYAGALAWTFYASDFGKMLDAEPGILRVNNLAPEHVGVDIGTVDYIPVVAQPIDNLIVPFDTTEQANYVDLNTVFTDAEGQDLSFAITQNAKPELVEPTISEDGLLSLAFPSGDVGSSALDIAATDAAGHTSHTGFVVQLIDPSQGDVALGKTAIASTIESAAYPADYAVDGIDTTRWSTAYEDGQWLAVDLGGVYTISQFVLHWETAYGAQYDLQYWDGSQWQTVYSEVAGDGQIDDVTLETSIDARYVRMNGVKRGTEWGFSLFEFEVNGIAVKNGDAALETQPPEFAQAEAAATETPAPPEAVGSEALLNSFEDGTEGWTLASYWASGKSMDVTGEMATDGSQSLAITASFSGTEWNEAGAYFDPPGGADWSAASQISADVYVPAGADNFLAQIFDKTGGDWTWANSPDIPLTPGAWTTTTADGLTLGALGDMSALHEYGVKVGTSTTAFDGQILIDNVRLIGLASTAAVTDESAAPTTPPVMAQVNPINSVSLVDENARLYEKVELVADVDASFSNPYDPADIRVDGRFTSPSGAVIVVPGFYYRDYTQTGTRIIPTNDWSWRVRFTPTEIGDYRYQVVATTLSGSQRSSTGTFTVAASDNPGFVRVDPRNPRYFAFDNGDPYFPVGEDMGWSSGNPLADYPHWLDQLSAAGGNWIRVWMASWGFGIEWLDTGLGNYDKRQANAYQLDQLLDMAADRNVYIMLTLLNHGAFNTTTDPEWNANPYNAANGGSLENPADFATNPEALRLWNQRLRYIAARWGYSPNIMAWEWWNEINWTALVNPDLLVPWIQRSAAYLGSLDPNHHLTTHSGSPEADTRVWGLDSISFVQNHLYNMDDLLGTFASNIPEWLQTYPDKPFLMGEFGSPTEIDTLGLLMHQGLWSAPMNGAAGTGMMWWWDSYVDPLDMYYQYTGVSNFFADEDLAASTWQPTTAAFTGRVRARIYGLQSSDSALLWVVNRDYSQSGLQQAYNRALRDALRSGVKGSQPTAADLTFASIDGAQIAVPGLAPGTYQVEFWDTTAGSVISETTIEAADGTAAIDLPSFSTDLALKIKPQ